MSNGALSREIEKGLFCFLWRRRILVKNSKTTEPVKVGILFSKSGVTSAMESSMFESTMYSLEEVNRRGGVDGRELFPIYYDPASDPEKFGLLADKLLTEDNVKIIFGCYMSSSRKAVLQRVEHRNALLCYPAQYEGFEYSRNIIYCGAAPNQNSVQLGHYLLKNFGKRFYLAGSDYIWPLESSRIMSEIVLGNSGRIVGQCYYKLHEERRAFDKLVKDIKRKAPDVIFCNFVGESIGHFYRAYTEAGLDPAKMPIASLTTSEVDIQAMGVEAGSGHITSAPYFQSVDTVQNQEFVKHVKARNGKDTVLSMCSEAAYFQVQIVADALKKVQSDNIDLLRPAILGAEFDAPQGSIKIDPNNAHTFLWPRIGRAKDDGQFEILMQSDEPVRPDPYLISFNPEEWSARLSLKTYS